MILGPSGENIYPEEIENVINNVEGVSESIVVERNGRLVALVQPMENYIEWDNENVDKIYDFIESWKKKLPLLKKLISKPKIAKISRRAKHAGFSYTKMLISICTHFSISSTGIYSKRP